MRGSRSVVDERAQRAGRGVLDALPVAVARLGRDYRVSWANDALARSLGRPAAELVGRTCRELGMAADDHAAFVEELERSFLDGHAGSFETNSLVDGEPRWIEYRFVPELAGGGRVASMLVVAFRNERAAYLHRRAAVGSRLLQAFLDHSPTLAWLRDADGRYRLVNRTYLERYGLRSEQILGRTVEERWSAEVARPLIQHDREVLASGRSQTVVEEVPDPDGTWRTWLNVKFPVADGQGRTMIGAVGVDVTERDEARRKLELSERLHAVAALAASSTHDFNNVLTAVLANTEAAREHLEAGSEPDIHLEAVVDAVERGATLVRSIQDMGDPKGPPGRTVELRQLVDETVRGLHPVLSGMTRVEVEAAPRPCPVQGEALALRRAVENLIVNAHEAFRGARSRSGTIRIRIARSADQVELTVEDNGPGIPQGIRERIFDPFFSTKTQGRGLGLCGVRAIVERHRGRITVECPADGGTRFRVVLPVASPP